MTCYFQVKILKFKFEGVINNSSLFTKNYLNLKANLNLKSKVISFQIFLRPLNKQFQFEFKISMLINS